MKRVPVMILIGVYMVTAACSVKKPHTEPEPRPLQTEQQKKKEAAELKKKKKRQRAEKELKEVVKQARPIIDNILDAIREDNHEKYIHDFNEAWKRAHSDKNDFLRINAWRKERIGIPERCQIKQIEKQPPYYIIHYYVKCSQVEKPVTIRMVLTKKETAELKVAFLTYKSPALRE